MTCSKLAVLNKAIQGTFFKSQKSKNRLKRQILIYLRKAVANTAIHGTFLSLKKVKKRIYGNYRFIFACNLEKCPGLLYLPLLLWMDIIYFHQTVTNVFSFISNKNFAIKTKLINIVIEHSNHLGKNV